MATFIRIKRRLCDEPLDSILARPKRRRLDGGEAESGGGGVEEAASPPLPPPTLLERVGTVESKDARIDASLLKQYKKGWEMRQSYKRLGGGGAEGWREEGRRMAKERERESREMITNRHRGDIPDQTTTTTTEKEENNKKRKKTQNTEGEEEEEEEEEEDEKKKKKEEEEEEEEEVQFYDAPLIRNGGSDVITCNGEPMESEKFVYDIYYNPQDTDWSEFVFEQPKLMEAKEEEEEEEDDENDENNWRNDYPEEEEEEEDEEDYVEEYDYMERPSQRRNMLGDSDESFDINDYDSEEDECGFDEDGNLITVASLGERLMMTTLKGGEESE